MKTTRLYLPDMVRATSVLLMFIIRVQASLMNSLIAWKARKSVRIMSLLLILCLSQTACTENNEINTDQLTKMKMKEIRLIKRHKNLSEYEKEEGISTINSIYSFTREIAYTKDSYYSPYVLEWITKERKFAGDNPDAQYFSFFIDPKVNYEIDVTHEDVFFYGNNLLQT